VRRNQSFRPPLSNTAVYFQHFTSCACLIAVLPSLTSGFLLPAPLPTDIAILDRQDRVAWRGVEMASHSPAPREKHTLTPLSGGRLLMFGGT